MILVVNWPHSCPRVLSTLIFHMSSRARPPSLRHFVVYVSDSIHLFQGYRQD